MNMQAFSRRTGVSAHTLRYYEKIGLLGQVQRNPSGHRIYTDKDFTWISFILRLKDTGMPLEGILQYAKLRAQGASTCAKRQSLLEAHRQQLIDHIHTQQQHLAALEAKIELYQNGEVA